MFNELERLDNDYKRENDEDGNESEDEGESRAEPKRKQFETEVTPTLNKLSFTDSHESPNHTPYSRSRNDLKNERNSENSGTALKSQEIDMDSGKTEIGVDTLNILEHMEALNSAANYLLEKKSYYLFS